MSANCSNHTPPLLASLDRENRLDNSGIPWSPRLCCAHLPNLVWQPRVQQPDFTRPAFWVVELTHAVLDVGVLRNEAAITVAGDARATVLSCPAATPRASRGEILVLAMLTMGYDALSPHLAMEGH